MELCKKEFVKIFIADVSLIVKNSNNLTLSQGIDLNSGASIWQTVLWLFKTPDSWLWMWEHGDVKRKAMWTIGLGLKNKNKQSRETITNLVTTSGSKQCFVYSSLSRCVNFMIK